MQIFSVTVISSTTSDFTYHHFCIVHFVVLDEWENVLERIKSTADAVEDDDSLELRFWASYRGQTLARTVRGMMYYRRALVLQSYLEKRYGGGIEDSYSVSDYISTQGYELSPEARAQADIKFTYVVSCQIYGQQKQKGAPEAADILLLMQRAFKQPGPALALPLLLGLLDSLPQHFQGRWIGCINFSSFKKQQSR